MNIIERPKMVFIALISCGKSLPLLLIETEMNNRIPKNRNACASTEEIDVIELPRPKIVVLF